MTDTKAPVIPAFAHTALDEIPTIADTLRTTFRSHKTKDVQYRLKQLRKLYWAIIDNAKLIEDALYQDMHMCKYEANLTEIDLVLEDIRHVIKNLETWIKDEPVHGMHPLFFLLKHRVHKEPLGTALVIGPYNFPLQLTVLPVVGAIAAGCTALMKPSESAPASAMVLKKLFDDALDPTAYRVVNGAIPETQALLEEKWDKIFYTGSGQVARIVAMKAAETLTPIALELGGMNPAFITKNATLPTAARRLMWAKTTNAGQVCLSQNYVLVERGAVTGFIDALKATYKEFFPKGAKESPDYARIINEKQFLRIKKMVDESKGKIVLGGEMDESQLYIEPTAVLVDSPKDSMMVEESFGPVFAIFPFDTLDEAIKVANDVYSTPLALFTFGSDKENKRVLNEVTSGGATINDAFIHACMIPAPFGGVGQSGQGSYHGRASFDCFTHRRTVAQNPNWTDKLIRMRFMPFTWKYLERMPRPPRSGLDFDREGNPIHGVAYWFSFLTSLGAKDPKGTLLGWILVLLSAYLLTRTRAVAA